MAPPLIRRNVAAHLGRGALLLLVVAMSTTFVVGSLGFSRHVGTALGTADEQTGGVPIESLSGTITVAADLGGSATPTAVDEDLLAVVRSVPGVGAATGTFDQPVSFALRASEQPDRPVQLRGLVFSSAFDETWEVVDGREPRGSGEIAVDLGGAVAGVTFLGDRADIQLPTGTRDVDVVGLVRRAGAAPAAASTNPALADAHAVFDAAVIADLLAAEGSFDRLTVVADGTVPVDELVASLRSELPAGLVVTPLTSAAGATQHTVSTLDDSVRRATLGFAAVSVIVAVVVIANVWSVIVAQRTRELALLRLLGASRRRIHLMVLAESSALGVWGAAIGALAGAWLGRVAATVVAEADRPLPFLLDGTMFLAAMVVGVGVTVVGSFGPARRASSVPPLAAMEEGWATPAPPPWWRRLAPTAAVVLGAILIVQWRRDPTAAVALGAVGALSLVVGAAAWSRAVVSPAMAALEWVVRSGSAVTRLAIGNARREPRRTAAAASTLLVGMTLVASVATAGASVRDTLANRFTTASDADFFLERRGLVRVDADSLFRSIDEGRAPLTAAAEVIAVDGVVRRGGETERRVVTADLGRIEAVVDVGLAEGSLEGGPGAAVSTGAADRLDVDVGGSVEVVSVSGRGADIPVVAIYDDTSVYGDVIVDRETISEIGAEGTFELVALSFDDRAPPQRVRRFLDSVAGEFPKVRVHDPAEFDRLNTSVADTVLRIVGVLLVGSLGMGAIGLSATVSLGVIERRRELSLVRVIGAERADLISMVRTESVIVAAVAGVIGMAVGVGLAAVGLLAAPPEVASGLVIPWVPLAVVEIVAAGLGVLAAVAPARRAATTSPLDALRDS